MPILLHRPFRCQKKQALLQMLSNRALSLASLAGLFYVRRNQPQITHGFISTAQRIAFRPPVTDSLIHEL